MDMYKKKAYFFYYAKLLSFEKQRKNNLEILSWTERTHIWQIVGWKL